MADNVRASAGTNDGAYFATEEISNVHHTKVVAEWSTGTDTVAMAAVATPLPVSNSAESSQMTIGGATVIPKFAVISATGDNTDTTLVAAVTSKKIRVLSYTVICSAASTSITFYNGDPDSAGAAISGAMPLTANSGIHAGYCPVGHFETSSGTLLALEITGTGDVYGHLTYIEV
jgi:hypothetical protein